MRHRVPDSGVKFARCAAILVYCSVRDWTQFCNVIGFENREFKEIATAGADTAPGSKFLPK